MVFPRLNTGQVLQSIPAVRSWLIKPMVFPDLCGVKKMPRRTGRRLHTAMVFSVVVAKSNAPKPPAFTTIKKSDPVRYWQTLSGIRY